MSGGLDHREDELPPYSSIVYDSIISFSSKALVANRARAILRIRVIVNV